MSEEDPGVDVVAKNWVKNSKRRAVQVLKTLSSLLRHSKYLKCENIVDLIKISNRVFIGEVDKLLIDNSPTDITAFVFLYNLQQPTRKIDSPDYFELLKVLQIKKEPVINSNAKNFDLENFSRNHNKKKKSRQEITETKAFEVSKASKTRQPEAATVRPETPHSSSDTDEKEEGFETPYEASEQKEKLWESYDE